MIRRSFLIAGGLAVPAYPDTSIDRSASMQRNHARHAGRHFLQIPGPTPVPDRILRAMDMPVIDHRGPEFQQLGRRVLEDIKPIFGTTARVFWAIRTTSRSWRRSPASR